MPATAARRIVPISLGRAFRIHFLLAVLSAAVVLTLAGLTADIRPGVRRGVWASLSCMAGYVLWKSAREPLSSTAVAIGIVVVVEAGFLFLGLLAPPQRPPLCETCGYNLTGASMDGRYPECGDPVMRSLGPDARPEAPWQHRAEIGLWRAWWLCTGVAIFRSRYFGRLIQLSADTRDHRVSVAMHLLAAFLPSFAGTLLCYYFSNEGWGPINAKMVTLLIGPTVGVIAAGSSCSFLLLFSWLATLRYRPPNDGTYWLVQPRWPPTSVGTLSSGRHLPRLRRSGSFG